MFVIVIVLRWMKNKTDFLLNESVKKNFLEIHLNFENKIFILKDSTVERPILYFISFPLSVFILLKHLRT